MLINCILTDALSRATIAGEQSYPVREWEYVTVRDRNYLVVHPFSDHTPTIAVVKAAVPRGATALRAVCHTLSDQGPEIEYSAWITSSNCLQEHARPRWWTIAPNLRSVRFLPLKSPTVGNEDLYLATRLKPDSKEQYAWASWSNIEFFADDSAIDAFDTLTYLSLNPDVADMLGWDYISEVAEYHRACGLAERRQTYVDNLWTVDQLDFELIQSMAPANSPIRNMKALPKGGLTLDHVDQEMLAAIAAGVQNGFLPSLGVSL